MHLPSYLGLPSYIEGGANYLPISSTISWPTPALYMDRGAPRLELPIPKTTTNSYFLVVERI